jgi:hypothetical protein
MSALDLELAGTEHLPRGDRLADSLRIPKPAEIRSDFFLTGHACHFPVEIRCPYTDPALWLVNNGALKPPSPIPAATSGQGPPRHEIARRGGPDTSLFRGKPDY